MSDSTTYTESAQVDRIRDILLQKEWIDLIDRLRPTDTLTIDVSDPEWVDIFLYDEGNFTTYARRAIFELLQTKHVGIDLSKVFNRLKIRLASEKTMPMEEINAKKEGESVSFTCNIIGTDSPKTFVKEADVMCSECFTVEHVRCGFDRILPTMRCMNPACKGNVMDVQKTGLVTEDIQTLILQQPLEDATKNSPITFYGKVTADQVGTSFVGQRKNIIGIFRSIIDPKKDENEVLIDILSITDVDDVEEIFPTPTEEQQIREDVKKEDFIEKLKNSFAPHIYGYDDIKLSCILQLLGGVPSKKRADINILLVGDPSMAKSELLKYGNLVTQKSIYTSGKGTTSAGLTIGMVKLHDGRMIAQAGVLPLCNNGHAFIDEFDKMNKVDRSSMHEAMEQQTVSIAKAGVTLTLDAKASILAAANPKYGNYDSNLTLMDNINIPSPLLSRFDLIWLIKDKVSLVEDNAKANHILDGFASNEPDKTCRFSERELTAFVNLAKKSSPELTREVRDEIVRIYEKLRQASNEEFTVGIRQLEALVRLSMAHAKMRLKDKVEVDDIKAVRDLLISMYSHFGIDISKGGNQSKLFTTGNMTKEQKYHGIWSECADKNGKVKLTEFMKKLEENGLSNLEATKLFHRWENTNTIKLMADGTYKKT